MKLTDGFEPHTDLWRQTRIGKLTSSLMFKIFVNGQGNKPFGVGGYTYLNQKIGEILTQTMFDDVPETDDIQRGLAGEIFALERFEEITGITVYPSKLYEYNAISCGTTDGAYSDDGINIKGIIEAKAPRAHKHLQILAIDAAIELKAIDPQYWHQIQSNLLFSETEQGFFISYNESIKHYDLQIRIIQLYADFEWRKDYVNRIGWVAEYFNEQITKILRTPERNLAYRIEQHPGQIEQLQDAITNIKNISI